MPSETTLVESIPPAKERSVPIGRAVKMDPSTNLDDIETPAEHLIKMSESTEGGSSTGSRSNKNISNDNDGDEDEGVEVVLNSEGSSTVVNDHHRGAPAGPPPNSQSVFRHPQAIRPRATRGAPYPPPPGHHHHHHPYHGGPPPQPPHGHYPYPPYGSGSWGYGPPPMPPPGMEGYGPPPLHGHPHPPYPVPPYPTSSGSFDAPPPPPEHLYGPPPHPHQTHYSPHVQYPAPRYGNSSGSAGDENINVISPHHKTPDGSYRSRGGGAAAAAPYYQYPPASPVSRPGGGGPRSLRNYAAMRRSNSPYSREYGERPFDAYGPPPPPASMRRPPPVVADSFDSAGQRAPSHPSTPKSSNFAVPSSSSSSNNKAPPPMTPSDPHMQFYGDGGSWGSFDSASGPPPPPPPHSYDDPRYYGCFPPDSPYSPYQQGPAYSPGLYRADSFPPPAYGPPPLPPSFSYSYEDEERLLQDYHPDQDGMMEHHHSPHYPHHSKFVTPPGQSKNKSNRSKSSTPVSSNISSRHHNALLPKAAEEIDFEVSDPPLEPILPESMDPVCASLADVNSYDVLCGRGGGTNSQVGNRRFRQLVQDFQPTYLMAKRKEKPLLARTIVLIIRKRGGRFLKKNDETGELYEVGDTKAEAKTSQALREGLDVRATKSAASAMTGKGGSAKKEKGASATSSPEKSHGDGDKSSAERTTPTKPESPPTLPQLEQQAGLVHPHSPDQDEFRKRRRVRSADRFFSDFMPPRADLPKLEDDDEDDDVLDDGHRTPLRRNGSSMDDSNEDLVYQQDASCGAGGCGTGCAGIALDIVTGAATSSFCLAPAGWRR